MAKRLIRFPNESAPVELEFDEADFVPDKEFGDVIFGYWMGLYVAVSKVKYN